MVPGHFAADETFNIGLDTRSPVSTDCASPFLFDRTIKKVVIALKPQPSVTADAAAKATQQTECAMAIPIDEPSNSDMCFELRADSWRRHYPPARREAMNPGSEGRAMARLFVCRRGVAVTG
jgi:hypothetical protein